jgi:hypothetical protein
MTEQLPTYNGCLCIHNADLHATAVAVLERFHVAYVCRDPDGIVWYEVTAITAQQYDAVIEALSDCGEPGIDWDFPLE